MGGGCAEGQDTVPRRRTGRPLAQTQNLVERQPQLVLGDGGARGRPAAARRHKKGCVSAQLFLLRRREVRVAAFLAV